ncbi:unnamed protein product [Rotaria sp. Silwood1]|nr:unnamed protein product [Rotaria sp. Silwood1]
MIILILDALIQFAELSSVTSILSHRNHIINGVYISMQNYYCNKNKPSSIEKLSSLTSLTEQNQITLNIDNNHDERSKLINYKRIMRENITLRRKIDDLNQALTDAQAYAKIGWDTYQVFQEKFDAEQTLTKKLKLECATITESYEVRLKELSSSRATTEQFKIKKELIDFDSQKELIEKYAQETKILKDNLERLQIVLGKSQTEVTLLNEKLIASERQFDNRHKELNNRYSNMKKQYEHLLSYTEEFFEKLYPHIQFKTESKECIINKSIEENNNKTNDSDNDILEIIMEDEPNCHVFNIFS